MSFRATSKKFLREKLPIIYPFIYRRFLAATHSKIDRGRINKYSNFIKRDFHTFELKSTKFDIMLDPSNGGVDLEIFVDKHFEKETLGVIKENLNGEAVFLDIGANIGQHSLYSSFFCEHVYSFEPVTKLYKQFSESIFKNDILNITPFNYGLGNENQELPIYSNGASMAASSVVATRNKKFIQNVKILRLDDVYEKIGIKRVDLMKIDVEGYELEVLLGSRNFINKFKPKILLEFSPYFYERRDKTISSKIINFLKDNQYKIFDKEADKEINKLEDLQGKTQVNLLCI